MSTGITIPPPLFRGQAHEQQHASNVQYFLQRRLPVEVLRFDLGDLSAAAILQICRMPSRQSTVWRVRTYAYAAGSGQYTVDVLWIDSTGATHSVFAVAGDRVTSLTASPRPVEKDATANLVVDPYDAALEGRFYVSTVGFAGTAWTAVVVEVLLIPRSRQ